jgi:radical SAM protein with 4Fe4S-binding SPASM domain
MGAKNSLLLDLNKNKAFRLNESAGRIIELGEQGLTVSDAVDVLKSKSDASNIFSFINDLYDGGFICMSTRPKAPNKISTSPKLEFLWIELTSACNQRCIHCYSDSYPMLDKGLSSEKIKQVIDEAGILGCKTIQFTGGECTLRKDLLELIMHAKSKDFSFIEIFTNGTLLDEPLIKALAKNKVHVAISIYSFRSKTHDYITGIPGSFDRTMKSLELLLAYGVSTRCETAAMKQNEDELDATCLFLSQLGVQKRRPDPIRPCGRGHSRDNWPKIYGLKSIQTRPCFNVSQEIYNKNKRGNSCWFGKASITSFGDVLPCIFARDMVAGNINNQKLSDIIYGDKMKRLWLLNHDNIEICRNCEYRYICGDCRPLAYGSTGDLFAKYPRCTYNPYSGEWGDAESAPIFNYNNK